MTVTKIVTKTVTKAVTSASERTPVNLIKRGNLYWSNLRLGQFASRTLLLPAPFGPVRVSDGGQLRISLKTGDRKQAQLAGYRLALAVEDWTQRQPSHEATTQPITRDDIQTAAAFMKAALLAADDQTYSEALTASMAGTDPERPADRELAAAVKLPPPGAAGDAKLLLMLRELIPFYVNQATGKTPTGAVIPEYAPFADAFRELHTDLLNRGKGKTVPTPPDPRPAKSKTTKASFGWDDLLAYYLAAHPALSERSHALYKLVIKNLAAFCKCSPGEIKRAQILDWRDSLVKQHAPKTALTRVRAGNSLYSYARVNLKLGDPSPVDAFEAVSVAGAKSAKSSRYEFSLPNLKKIFASPPDLAEIPAAAGAHAVYWLPLLALYTGARREEITDLLAEEVDEEGSIWFLDLKDNDLRKLKVASCTRRVPLHNTLIDLGFLDYVAAVRQAGVRRLFPALVNSKRCAEFIIDQIHQRITPPAGVMQDIHSFRHTFKSACRSVPLAQEVHDALTGHKTPGVSSTYGSVAALPTLKKELDKIDYPGVVLTAPPCPTSDQLQQQELAATGRARAGKVRAG
jgi:integrase